MYEPEIRNHLFSFGGCCISVTETPCSAPLKADFFFLHGRLSDSRSWQSLLRKLQPGIRCITIDLPGFGRSFSPEGRGLSLLGASRLLTAITRHFCGESPAVPPILVGHDTGGALAQICLSDPDCPARGAVLINPASLLTQVAELGAWGKFLFRKRLRRRVQACARIPEEDRQIVLSPWRRIEIFHERVRAINTLTLQWPGHYQRLYWKKQLAVLEKPLLLVWGSRDPVNHLSDGMELLRHAPGAALFTEQEAGHWPHLENPEWVATKLQEFLFQLSAAEAASPLMRARRSPSR